MFRRATTTLLRSATRSLATAATEAPVGSNKLTLNFVLPHQAIYKGKEVHQVNLSGASGDIGVLANHVPIIEELKPGALEVVEKDGKKNLFFVSGGFAIVHPDSTLSVNAVEAFPLASFDKDAVRKGLDEANNKLASAKEAKDQAEAKIEIEVFTSLEKLLK